MKPKLFKKKNKKFQITSPQILPIIVRGHLNESFVAEMMNPIRTCLFPSYFSNYAVLILIAASIVSQLSHISKIILMTLITGKLVFYKINYCRDQQYNNFI